MLQKSSSTQKVAGTESGTDSSDKTEETDALNTNTHKFHRLDCSSINTMSGKNKKFAT